MLLKCGVANSSLRQYRRGKRSRACVVIHDYIFHDCRILGGLANPSISLECVPIGGLGIAIEMRLAAMSRLPKCFVTTKN